MARNITRRGILLEQDRMIICRVSGELADGSKVWQEIDPKTGEFIDDGVDYLLYTRGGWSEFEQL